MNLFRTLGAAATVCVASAGLSSCLNAPNYPVEPAIDFKSLTIVHVPATSNDLARDTLKFALDFRDGDGDLGLSDADIKTAPWNASTGGVNNRGYSFNYFIEPYAKGAGSSNVFTPFVTPFGVKGEYDGRFFRLDAADAKPSPLKGTLNYKLVLNLDGAVYYPGQVLKFDLSIMDRALHQSNRVTTTAVMLGR